MNLSAGQTVTVSQTKGIMRSMLASDKAKTTSIALWGPPGIGKTQMMEQVADEIGAKCKVFLTATMDPTDVVGVPHPVLGKGLDITKFLPPEDLLCLTEEAEDKGAMIALFDDMPACEERVFAALYRIFQQREVGGRKIRDNVLLCATGNRVEDRAGAQELPTALANRFIHFTLRVDNNEWRQWAMKNDIVEEIVAFIRTKPDALHDFKPNEGFMAFPTPRSVAKASDLVHAIGYNNEEDLSVALEGCCGQGWSTSFMAFQKVRYKLVPPDEIVKDPEKARVPDSSEVDVTFATMTSLVYYLRSHLGEKEVINGLHWSTRLPQREMGISLAHDIMTNVILEMKDDSDLRSKIMGSDVFRNVLPTFQKYLREEA